MLGFASMLALFAAFIGLIKVLIEAIVSFIVWIKQDYENKERIQKLIKAQEERRSREQALN